jgi:hypothetical protein
MNFYCKIQQYLDFFTAIAYAARFVAPSSLSTLFTMLYSPRHSLLTEALCTIVAHRNKNLISYDK